MNSTVENTIKALVEHKKYDAITEYANVVHGKNNLIVSEYGGANVRLYKDNDNNVRILCPKKMETVQEGYLAKAIADGSVFDDAEDIDRNATVIERTTLPYDAMINAGKEPPRHLKPMIAIVVGRMGDDGSFAVSDADRTNGVNFVKDATNANANGEKVNDVVDNYLEKEDDGFYTPDVGKNISGLNNELDDVNDTDPADVVSDDDTVDSYDGYDMNDFERDPDVDDDEPVEGPEEPEEDEPVNDNPPADEPDEDSDDDNEDEPEEIEECGDSPVEECGDTAAVEEGAFDDLRGFGGKAGEEYIDKLNKKYDDFEKNLSEANAMTRAEAEECGLTEEELKEYGIHIKECGNNCNTGDKKVVQEEDDAITTETANSIIARYKKVSECGNTTTPTNGRTIVQEDEAEAAEAPVETTSDPTEPIADETGASEDIVEETSKPGTEMTQSNGAVNNTPSPMSATTKDLAKNIMHQEGFLSKKPKKLKPIGRDVVAYITCEMNDIHSANDQAMLAGYTCSKIELVDWYITVLDTNDPKYMVPHTRQYLITMKAQLESLLSQILKIRPINRTDQIWRVNYPSYQA